MYSFEHIQLVNKSNFEKGFKIKKESFDTQQAAVEAYISIVTGDSPELMISTPDAIGFSSINSMQAYLEGKLEKSKEYYNSMIVD